jgi:hypothetical protein
MELSYLEKLVVAHILKKFPAIYRTRLLINVGLEVFTPVVMKISIFWDITLCSLWKVSRRFGVLLAT